MSLPNATAMLSTLPGGLRITASRGGVVASQAYRFLQYENGNVSDAGLDSEVRTHIWTEALAFGTVLASADLLMTDVFPQGNPAWTPAIVISNHLSSANLLQRAEVLFLPDVIQVSGLTVAAHVMNVARTTELFVTGTQADESESITTHASLFPDTQSLPNVRDPVIMPDGSRRSILSISTDQSGLVLSIRATRKGAQS